MVAISSATRRGETRPFTRRRAGRSLDVLPISTEGRRGISHKGYGDDPSRELTPREQWAFEEGGGGEVDVLMNPRVVDRPARRMMQAGRCVPNVIHPVTGRREADAEMGKWEGRMQKCYPYLNQTYFSTKQIQKGKKKKKHRSCCSTKPARLAHCLTLTLTTPPALSLLAPPPFF